MVLPQKPAAPAEPLAAESPAVPSIIFPPWWTKNVESAVDFLPPDPVPGKFTSATLEHIPNKNLRNMVRNYGRSFYEVAPRGLAPLLLGPMAVYKSYTAAVMAKQIRQVVHLKTDWVDCPVLLNKFERRRFDPATDERIEQLKNTGWLVMDDFAFVRLGTWQSDLMAEIACYRFDHSMPICWTGNVDLAPSPDKPLEILSEVVGGQLARRMLEASEGYRLLVGRPK